MDRKRLILLNLLWMMGVHGLLSNVSRATPRTLTLDQAYALALKNNPNIRILRERVVQAEVARFRAWSAIKPNANFQGSFTHYDQEIILETPASVVSGGTGTELVPIVIQKMNQFAFGTTVNLPLLHGSAYPRIGMAKKGVDVAKLQEIRSRQDFLLQVAQAYYLIINQSDAVKALENKLVVDKKHLASAKTQFEVGQVARSNVLRADLVVTQDQQNLRTQRNNLEVAKRQLGILIGADTPFEVERPSEPPRPDASEQSMVSTAMQQRTDLRAAALSLKIAQQTRNAFWWEFAPSLDFSWNYRWNQSTGFSGENSTWNLMLVLNLPIYDAGLRYANLRENRSQIFEAIEQERSLRQDIKSNVIKLRADLDSAQAGVISARKAVELAKTTAADMEASYEVGAATQLDVLDTSQRLLDAELQMAASLYQRDLARLSLAHALGRFKPHP